MTGFLNYCWRLVATGISFSVFGIGGLIMASVVFPLVHLRYRDKASKTRVSRKLIHQAFRLFIRMMAFLGISTFEIGEVEKQLAEHQGKIVIANHPSLIDVVVLISLMPHADCIIKEKLWDNVFMRGVLSAAGYIKNSGDIESLIDSCKTSLQSGYSLIVFPEGTRTTPNRAIGLQRGAANIALRCNADMVTVLIKCDPTTLTKNEPWYNIPARKFTVSLRIGRIFRAADYVACSNSISVQARRLTEDVRTYFIESLGRHG